MGVAKPTLATSAEVPHSPTVSKFRRATGSGKLLGLFVGTVAGFSDMVWAGVVYKPPDRVSGVFRGLSGPNFWLPVCF